MKGYIKDANLILVLVFLSLGLWAQQDNVGSGRALALDGINDFIDLGDRYDGIQLPVTISAWINLSPTVNNWAPVFVSQDNSPVYNGFWLIVQPNLISVGYGDGNGENLLTFRRSKTASVNNISGRWIQVTGIIRGKLDMDIFVNGMNVGGNYSGDSDYPMSSSSLDVAKIGRWYSNGQTFHFKGRIDEVRLWNKALTQNEVRQLMCRKLSIDEPALVGWWTFNEETENTIFDRSPNKFNGLLNEGFRIYSGAPIGDASSFLYTNQWHQKSVSITSGDDSLTVTNIRGYSYGLHVYRVNEMPSLADGISECARPYYFGVYIDSDVTSDLFDVHYVCKSSQDNTILLSSRVDNSSTPWSSVQAVNLVHNLFKVENAIYRGEYIALEGLSLSLGEDKFVCDQDEVILTAGMTDPSITYNWSNGSTAPSIAVKGSGSYSLNIQNECGTATDEIYVEMDYSPPSFSFGSKPKNLCADQITLKPYDNPNGYAFTWSNGSQDPVLTVNSPGSYSVTIENRCGSITNGSL